MFFFKKLLLVYQKGAGTSVPPNATEVASPLERRNEMERRIA